MAEPVYLDLDGTLVDSVPGIEVSLAHALAAAGVPARVADWRPFIGPPVRQVVALYLHAFASALVQAAVRFVPLGQTEGQAVLAALHPVILQVAAKAAQVGIDQIGSGAFRSDLAAMRHETMDVRIFRT